MPASIRAEISDLRAVTVMRKKATFLDRSSYGSAHIAHVLGDDGGVSYVCTACGHSGS